jgi:DNA polymerase-3 subunit epsilon
MEFTAIDVETANADMATICQIGIARYRDGDLVEEWCSLIDPEDYFDGFNIDIHGITEEDVQGAPVLPDVLPQIRQLMENKLCVCHTHFDRVSLSRDMARYGFPELECRWLDSARVVRRAWRQFSHRGYGIKNVCLEFGYEFKHHDALEDAKAAAFLLHKAIEVSGIPLEDWPFRITRPIGGASYNGSVKHEGNPEGDLFGECVCFTGALQLPRSEAADLAAQIGCAVSPGVTRKITMLVVGDQDLSKLAVGEEKSSKHRKAEQLIEAGQPIRILKESDFLELVSQSKPILDAVST